MLRPRSVEKVEKAEVNARVVDTKEVVLTYPAEPKPVTVEANNPPLAIKVDTKEAVLT